MAKKLLFYFWGKTFLWERGSAGKNKLSGFCKMVFPLERGSAGQGGRGDSDLPPMPPWTPYTPFKRPRDTPGPPLRRRGYFPLFLDRQEPHRARPLFCLGPAANRAPQRVRTLHGILAAARTVARFSYRGGSLPPLQG